MKKISPSLIFSTILLLGGALRLYKLSDMDFWYDEAFTGVAIKESFSDMLSMIIQDVHPPLYYMSVQFFSTPFDHSVFGIRFFSLLFGMLGIWGVFLFAKELFSTKVALYASFLTAISPFLIQYSQEGRMYSMLGALLLFSSYFFLRSLRTNSIKDFTLWSVFLGLSFLTHYLALLFAPMFFFVFLIWRSDGLSLKTITKKEMFSRFFPIKGVILGYLGSVLIFLPWLPQFLKHYGTNNLDWIQPATLGTIFHTMHIFLLGIPRGEYAGMPFPNPVFFFETPTITFLIAIGVSFLIAFTWRKNPRKTSVLLFLSFGFMLFLMILSLFDKHYLVSRYVLPCAYFFSILLGFWLSKLNARYTFVIIAVYSFFLLTIPSPDYPRGFTLLTKESDRYEGKTFYLLNSFDYVIAKYYFGPEKVVLFNIDWPQYDSTIWAAIGKEKLRKTENYADVKKDPNGIILHNTQYPWESRSDRSFSWEAFPLLKKYENISVYRSIPKEKL